MTARTVRLVRHGRAAAGWDADPDPDLDEVGRRQAAEVAGRLPVTAATTILTSPLLRCRSTAAAFESVAGVAAAIDPRVAEIPSPEGVALSDRIGWLRVAMQGTWTQLGERYTAYRDAVVGAICEMGDETVVFSHFVAINAVIGACLDDDRLVARNLDHCSVTTVVVDHGRVRLLEGGREADTVVR